MPTRGDPLLKRYLFSSSLWLTTHISLSSAHISTSRCRSCINKFLNLIISFLKLINIPIYTLVKIVYQRLSFLIENCLLILWFLLKLADDLIMSSKITYWLHSFRGNRLLIWKFPENGKYLISLKMVLLVLGETMSNGEKHSTSKTR